MEGVLYVLVSVFILIILLNLFSQSIDSRYTVFPQLISNLGSNIVYGFQTIIYGFLGKAAPVNPKPYKGQPIDRNPDPVQFVMNPPEMKKIFRRVDGEVANI